MKKRLYDTSRGALNNVKMHISEARYLLTLVRCRVDYCEHTYMLSHIPDAETPKEAWENLKKIFSANTITRNLQLRQELNTIR